MTVGENTNHCKQQNTKQDWMEYYPFSMTMIIYNDSRMVGASIYHHHILVIKYMFNKIFCSISFRGCGSSDMGMADQITYTLYHLIDIH